MLPHQNEMPQFFFWHISLASPTFKSSLFNFILLFRLSFSDLFLPLASHTLFSRQPFLPSIFLKYLEPPYFSFSSRFLFSDLLCFLQTFASDAQGSILFIKIHPSSFKTLPQFQTLAFLSEPHCRLLTSLFYCRLLNSELD